MKVICKEAFIAAQQMSRIAVCGVSQDSDRLWAEAMRSLKEGYGYAR